MMRVAQVSRANGPLELVEREILEPGPNAVRVAVDACARGEERRNSVPSERPRRRSIAGRRVWRERHCCGRECGRSDFQAARNFVPFATYAVTDDLVRREARTGFGAGESITAGGVGPGVTAWSSWAMPANSAASVEAVSGGASITRPP